MKIQLRVVSVLLAVAIVSLNCRANPKDDQFARSFIDRLNRRDSSAVLQFEPNSVLSEAGWNKVVTAADRLPPPPPDSILLVEWERGRDPRTGPYRKLTYLVDRGSKEGRVELWLVSRNGRTYVNTVRTTEMVPDTFTDR